MNQIYSDESLDAAWKDVFPWILQYPWINEPSTDSDVEKIASLASSALLHQRRTRIGELFPSLDNNVQLLRLAIPNKVERGLRNNDIYTGRELKPFTIEEILDWRGLGESAVAQLLELVAGQTIRDFQQTENTWRPGYELPEVEAPTVRRPAEEIAQALEELAQWYIAIGAPDVPILSVDAQSMGTERTFDIHDDFLSLTALDILAPEKQHSPIASVFSGIVDDLEERQIKILEERVFSDDPKTLDELGVQFQLTRERVRQLEKMAKDRIIQGLEDSEITQELLALIGERVHEIRPLEDLLLSYPALREPIEGTTTPLWLILNRLDKDYTKFDYLIEDGWILPRGKRESIDQTKKTLESEANEYGVLPLEQVDVVATQHLDADAANKKWLEYCSIVVDDTYVYLRSTNHGDRVCAILSISGAPMSTDAIESKIPGNPNPRSILNAIQADERITRVDRNIYALSEWGMPVYEGIKTSINNYLESHDGEAPILEMVKALTSDFDISEKSVRAYAAAPPFHTADGIVTFAHPGARSKKRAEDTPRLFRSDSGWKYRMMVTSDHLRGSGFGVPMSFATIFDMRFGERRSFSHPLGEQTISWTTNIVASGSIRRILQDQNIPEGDEIFLHFGSDDTFSISEALKQEPNFLANPLKEAARLIDVRGVDAFENVFDEVFTALCRAVGAAPTIMPFPLISLLQAKGDTDIAKALTVAVDNAKRMPR